MYAIGTFAREGEQPFPGLVLDGERVVDLSGYGWRDTNQILNTWATAHAVLDRLTDGSGDISLADVMTLVPLEPNQILQSGANYRKHVIDLIVAEELERGSMSREQAQTMGAQVMDERVAAGEPYVFLGAASAVNGPYDDVVLPRRGEQHDWELELAAVIGRPARNLTRENALDHVAGYTISNDITTRSLVYRRDLKAIGTDWFAAKNAPTFLPTGPFLVPAAFAGDPEKLRIRLKHNGIIRQDESCADMLFDLPQILAYITAVTELGPGDLVLTGSPAGNGAHWGVFLAAGDVLEGEITGLGRQRNHVTASTSTGTP
jgi:2-keto-4-pentenoate hydratase/2-oxohepta-3-ene-1,7-dioic acid hydratase in catechol pathway